LLQAKYDFKKDAKKNSEFKKFINNHIIIDQIKEDDAWNKDAHANKRKKVFGFQTLEDDKFEEKVYSKKGFCDKEISFFEHQRESLMFKENRLLTPQNKKLLSKIKKVYD